MALGVIYLSILGAGLIAGIVSAIFIHRRLKRHPPENQYVEEETQIISIPAKVDSKRIEKQMTGSYYQPGHWILHIVLFKTADEELSKFVVSDSVYDGLHIGDSGTLVYQGGNFLGFECAMEGDAVT